MATVHAAAVYARISSDQDGHGLGVKRQREDCRKLAKERGWTIAEVYEDNDVSAFSGRTRPEYQRMLMDLGDGLRDAVIVYNLDRLTRRPIELEQFLTVCEKAGVTDVATVTADIDLGNDDGLFMARLYAAVAAKESGRKSARMKRKFQQNAEAGLPHGGSHRPFGYDQTRMKVIPAEAKVIRQLVERLLAGESARSLAVWLQAEGVPSVTGKPWRSPSLLGILRSGRIAGLRQHQGAIIGPAAWPAIITEDQHRRVVAVLDQRAVTGKRAPRRYVLSGLLRCGKCGGKLFSAARQESRRYVCLSGPDHNGCGRLTVVAEPLETFLVDAVLFRLDSPRLQDALAGRAAKDAALNELVGEVAADQEQLRELAQAYGQKAVTMREWLDARKPIEDRIESGQRRLARATHSDALVGLPGNGAVLRAKWQDLSTSRQAAIISAVLEHAVIGAGQPGSRSLDPARITPRWRL